MKIKLNINGKRLVFATEAEMSAFWQQYQQ